MIFNSPQDYIIPAIGYTQAELDAAVEAAIEATKEKAAKVCDEHDKQCTFKHGLGAAIRSMK